MHLIPRERRQEKYESGVCIIIDVMQEIHVRDSLDDASTPRKISALCVYLKWKLGLTLRFKSCEALPRREGSRLTS